MPELIAIDLCSGGGGWACAARGLPVRVGLAVDLWHPACVTYQLNHPETHVIEADLRDAGTQETVLEFAAQHSALSTQHSGLIVLGGIPCEWLSAYRRLVKVGAAERAAQRATLDAVLELVKRIDPPPRWWCLEDVKELARELTATMKRLGYVQAGDEFVRPEGGGA